MLAPLVLSMLAAGISTPTQAVTLGADLSPDSINFFADTRNQQTQLNYALQVLLTEDEGDLFAGKIYSYGPLNAVEGMDGGLGAKIMHVDADGGSFQALGLGGFLELAPEALNGVRFGLEVYYSPSITITDDVDSVVDLSLTASYKAFENASVYAGVRDINVDFGPADDDIDSAVFIGFQLEL